MKKLITFLAFIVTISINAQTKYDKTITVIIKDFSEACGEEPGDAAFCLTDEQGAKITERYSCNMTAGLWQVEPKDLITEKWELATKYKGKKATIYCAKHPGGAGWVVKKVEFGVSSASVPSSQPDTGLDTDLDKYIGCYKFLNSTYSISKFPTNSLVPLKGGCVPLDKNLIGKYFLVKNAGLFCSDTTKVDAFKCKDMKGFIMPTDYTGGTSFSANILVGVEKKGGRIHNQNYTIGDKLFLGEAGASGFNYELSTKFILRADGKYDLYTEGATFIRQ